jgi:autotransporter-associated beta strand protein
MVLYTWIGPTSGGAWNLSTNWSSTSPSTYPSLATDTVVINNAARDNTCTITLSSDISIQNVKFTGDSRGGSQTILGSGSYVFTINNQDVNTTMVSVSGTEVIINAGSLNLPIANTYLNAALGTILSIACPITGGASGSNLYTNGPGIINFNNTCNYLGSLQNAANLTISKNLGNSNSFVKNFSSSTSLSLFGIKSDGTLWAWGDNTYGQLGDGTTTYRPNPVQIGIATNWLTIACGSAHTFGTQADSTVWGWGLNTNGQLGNGTNTSSLVPIKTSSFTLTSISCGAFHSSAIVSGVLYSWGLNSSGQLGDGTTVDKNTPVQESTATSTWTKVACGNSYTVGIRADGSIWAWGLNDNGQLGDNTLVNKSVPTREYTASTLWTQVACGVNHTMAKRSTGALYAWGNNTNGQLGDGTLVNKSVPTREVTASLVWNNLSCGESHSVATRNDNSLWAWGTNINGQLGNGTLLPAQQISPIQIGTITAWSNIACGPIHTMATMTENTNYISTYVWGSAKNTTASLYPKYTFNSLQPSKIRNLPVTNAVISTGVANHFLSILADGTLWAWGNNSTGQLGNGTIINSLYPVQIGTAAWKKAATGNNFSLGIQSDNTLWAWGNNSNGQFGNGGTTSQLIPTKIGSSFWINIKCGYSFSIGVQLDGSMWVWGNNDYKQIGNTTGYILSPSKLVFPISGINWTNAEIACVYGTTTVICRDTVTVGAQGLWAWGYNQEGQLGTGVTNNNGSTFTFYPPSFVPAGGTANGTGAWKKIIGGGGHFLAIDANDFLWGWGRNDSGVIGNGTSGYSSSTGQPRTKIGSATWIDIAGGQDHSIAIQTNGTLWAWGQNNSGQFGNGTLTTSLQTTPIQIGSATNWVKITSINQTICGMKDDGLWYSCGLSTSGQLGIVGPIVMSPYKIDLASPINNSGTITIANSTYYSLTSNISGSGTIIVNGAAGVCNFTTSLSSHNFILNAGPCSFIADESITNTNINVAAGIVCNIYNNYGSIYGNLTKSGSGTLTIPSITGVFNPSYACSNSTITLSGGTILMAGKYTGTSLTVSSSGTLIVTSDNSGSCSTTISASATVQVGDGVLTTGSLNTGNIVNNGTLLINRASDLTINSSISGSGIFNKLLATTVTLAGTYANTGTTTISAGTLITNNTFSNAALAIIGTLNCNIGGILSVSGLFSGTGNMINNSGTSLSFLGSSSFSGILTATAATTIISSTNAFSVGSSNGIVNTSGITFNLINLTDTLSLASASFSGAGTVTKIGLGILALTGAIAYSGTTTITAGTLQFDTTPTSSSFIISSGTTLSFIGTAIATFPNALSSTSTGTLENNSTFALTLSGLFTGFNGIIKSTSGPIVITSPTFDANAIINNNNLTFNIASDLSIVANLSGSGTLTKNSTNKVTLTNSSNTASGAITVNSGILAWSNSIIPSSIINTVSGSTFSYTYASASTNSKAINGAGTFECAGTGVFTIWGVIRSILKVNSGATIIRALAAVIFLPVGLIIDGNLNLTLQDYSTTYPIISSISNTGIVTISSSNAATSASITTFTDATAYQGQILIVNNSTTYISNLRITSSTQCSSIGIGLTGSGNTAFTYAPSSATTFSSTISGLAGNYFYNDTLAGNTTSFTANSTFAGIISLTSGNLSIQSPTTFTSPSNINGTGTGTVTFNMTNDLTITSAISGAIAIAKSNTNNLTLSTSYTNTGTMTINAGKLTLLNIAIPTTSAITIGASGTLTYSNTSAASYANAITSSAASNFACIGTGTFTPSFAFAGIFTVGVGATVNHTGQVQAAKALSQIINNGTFAITDATVVATYASISGTNSSASLTKAGASTVTITDCSTYIGAITVNAATLQLNSITPVTTTSAITINASSTLTYAASGTTTLNNPITGSGTFENTTGIVSLAGNTSVTNMKITSGTVTIINTTFTTTNINNLGNIIFNLATDLSTSAVIIGTGSLTKSNTNNLTLSSAYTYTGTTLINAGNLTLLNISIPITSAITIGASGTLTYSNTSAASYANAISSSATSNFACTGTGIFTPSFAFTGKFTIASGATVNHTAQVQAVNALSQIINNGTFAITDATVAVTYASISGTNSSALLTKAGASTVTITDCSTYTGAITVNAATLQLNSITAASAITINASSTLTYATSGTTTLNNPITGSGTFENITGIVSLAGNTSVANMKITSGTVTIINTTFTTANINNLGNLTFNLVTDLSLASTIISGTGSLTKSNTNVVTIGGNYSASGAVTVSSGTLQLNQVTAALSIPSLAISGIFNYNGASTLTITGAFTGAGTFNNKGAAALIFSGSSSTFAGTLIASSVTTITATTASFGSPSLITNTSGITFNLPSALALAASIFSGSGTITKSGVGTLSLTGAIAYAGTTSITAGTLQFDTAPSSSSFTITSPGIMSYNSTNAATLAGTITGTGTLINNGTGILTLSGTYTGFTGIVNANTGALIIASSLFTTGSINNTAGVTFNTTTGNLAFASSIFSGTGTVTKSGTGTLSLTGTIAYAGATSITAGTLQFDTAPTGSSFIITSPGIMSYNSASTATLSRVITGTGTLINNGTGILTLSGTYTGFTGTVNANTGALIITSSTFAASSISNTSGITFDTTAGNVALAASIFSGSGTVTKSGVGTLSLTGAIAYAGATSITTGTLQFDTAPTGSSFSITSPGIMSYNSTNAGTLARAITGTGTLINNGTGILTLSGIYTGFTGTVNANTGALIITSSTFAASSISNISGITFDTTAGNLAFTSSIFSGAGAVTKLGTGTLSLTGAIAYAGATSITAGTLQFDTAPTGSSFTITSSGIMSYNSVSDATLARAITGTGTLINNGTGILTLSGTYTGFTGTVNANTGALIITSSTFTAGSISNTSGLTFNLVADLTLGAIISGTGSLTTNNNNLTLTSAYTYTGTTTINGNLTLLNISIPTSSAITIGTSGILTYSNTNAASYAGPIINSSTSTFACIGTGIFTPSFAFAGIFTIGVGATVNHSAQASFELQNIINNGTFATTNTVTTIYSLISGSGLFTKNGSNGCTISDCTQFSGAITVIFGYLVLNSIIAPSTSIFTVSSLSSTLSYRALGTSTFSNAVTGVGTLGIANSGQTSVTGNINVGTFLVSGLTIITNSSFSPSTITIGSGNLMFDFPTDLSISSAINGYGILTKSNTNKIILTGNYISGGTGKIIVNSGTLNLDKVTAALSLSSLEVSGIFNYNGTSALTVTGAFSGTGTFNNNSTSLLKFSGSTSTFNGTFNALSATTITATSVSFGSPNVINNAAGITFNLTGTLALAASIFSGSGTVIKSGVGTLSLTGAIAYTGATTITAGTLQFDTAPTGSSFAITSPGIMSYNSTNAATLASTITGTGTLVNNGIGILTLSGNYSGFTGTVNATSGPLYIISPTFTATTINNTNGITFDTSSNLPLSSNISGAGTFTKLNTNTITITNTYANTGFMNISNGSIIIKSSSFVSPSTINNNGSIQFELPTDVTISSTISGNGAIIKTGTNTLTFGGDSSTFTGSIQISLGSFIISNPLFAAKSIINNSANALLLNFASPNFTLNASISGSASTILDASSINILTLTGDIIAKTSTVLFNSKLIINGRFDAILSSAIPYIVTINDTGTLVSTNVTNTLFNNSLNSTIDGTGTFEKNGKEIVIVSGAQTFAGIFNILDGGLIINTPLILRGIINNSNIAVELDLLAASSSVFTIGSLSGASTSANILNVTGVTSLTFTGDVTATNNISYNGNLTVGGQFNASIATPISNILTILPTGNYNSVINIISGATLIVNGNVSQNLTIPNGCILKGNGTVAGTIIQSGGILSVGNSPGLLTVNGDLALASNTLVIWEIATNSNSAEDRGISYDGINIVGNLSIDYLTNLQVHVFSPVNFSDSFWNKQRLWTFIQAGGYINRDFQNIELWINGINNMSPRYGIGEFYSLLRNINRITIGWVVDAGAGGDPYITTLAGDVYTLPNIQQTAEIYNNGELTINSQMKTMPWKFWTGNVGLAVRKSTYMYKTRINIYENELIIDNHTLEMQLTNNNIKYSYEDCDMDSYSCYGRESTRGMFKAKILTLETDKLKTLKIVFVTLDDKTIINDMRILAHPALLEIPATGALMSSKDVKWTENFSN